MAGKSRRRQGKYAYEDKLRKSKQIPTSAISEEQVATQVPKAAAATPALVPATSVPHPKPTPAIAKHPEVTGELRRIGIIAGIMLAVLVILSFTLP